MIGKGPEDLICRDWVDCNIVGHQLPVLGDSDHIGLVCGQEGLERVLVLRNTRIPFLVALDGLLITTGTDMFRCFAKQVLIDIIDL